LLVQGRFSLENNY